ncbi:hypothetical protein [Mesorhizobium sp. WSM2561]|uniref:hypothetical protein n=1 Tax=Mesorhizobium sp. WSM2561 TaxID=1040985 RepID=UPI0012EBDC6D|nr:hypothetical protein [Mesorhizobium sp. WSM2561]
MENHLRWLKESGVTCLRLMLDKPRFAACGDDSQAVVWLVRNDTIGRNGMLRAGTAPIPAVLELPGLARGTYRVIAWDTAAGRQTAEWQANSDGWLRLEVPPFSADAALAVRRI